MIIGSSSGKNLAKAASDVMMLVEPRNQHPQRRPIRPARISTCTMRNVFQEEFAKATWRAIAIVEEIDRLRAVTAKKGKGAEFKASIMLDPHREQNLAVASKISALSRRFFWVESVSI